MSVKGNHASAIIYFFILILLINAPDLIYFLETKQYFLGITSSLSVFSLFGLALFFFRKNLKLYAYLLIPVLLLLPSNFVSVLIYSFPINDTSFFLVAYTNMGEFMEQASGNFGKIMAGILVYAGVLLFLIYKTPKTIERKQASIISMLSLAVFLLLPFVENSSGSYLKKLRGKYYSVYPTSLLYSYAIYHNQDKLKEATEAQRNKFSFHVQHDTALHGKQIHVLIMGESARYNSWGINGYTRNTTPKLSKRANLLTYSDVMTGGYITEFAIPLILTGVSPDSFNRHYLQKSIVSAFNEAGFDSYWIANQIYWGHLKIHSFEAHLQFMVGSDSRATKNVRRDMDLLNTLKKALAEPGDKKFIVFHTLGSHYVYSSRYPDDFDVFKPSNKTVFSQSDDIGAKDVLINSYDNTIVYEDAFIDSVISLVSAQQAIASVTYVSDHGENLFDDERNLSQHAFPVPSKYVAHIPLFVWYSPQLENAAPSKIAAMKSHVHSKISTQNLIYTITSLGGFSYPAQDPSKNIASPYFMDNLQLILGANNKVFEASKLN